MKITEVRISLTGGHKLKAFVTINFDGTFVVRGIKVIEGDAGRLLVAMPSRRKRDGSYQDVAHPITSDFRIELEKAILDEYNRVLQDRLELPPGNG